MSQEHNMRRVTAIRNGTVIDHIPSGQAMRVLEMLNINILAENPPPFRLLSVSDLVF